MSERAADLIATQKRKHSKRKYHACLLFSPYFVERTVLFDYLLVFDRVRLLHAVLDFLLPLRVVDLRLLEPEAAKGTASLAGECARRVGRTGYHRRAWA